MNEPNKGQNEKIGTASWKLFCKVKVSDNIGPGIRNGFYDAVLSIWDEIVNVISANHIKSICETKN